MGKKRNRKAVQAKEEEPEEEEVEPEADGEESPEEVGSEDFDSDSEDYDISDSEEEDEAEDEEEKEEVMVDFEFFDPKESDFHGVRALLQNYLDGAPFPGLSDLIDTIIEQKTVGTVVRTSEDEAPVGVVSVLNLKSKGGLPCVQQLLDFLKGKCASDKTAKNNFQKVLDAPEKVGLVVNERLVNCPPELSPPVVQALFDEISWAVEDEPTKEKRESFIFNKYLIFTRVFRDKAGGQTEDDEAPGPSKKKQKKAAAPAKSGTEEELTFLRVEDEVFHQLCTWSHMWNVENKPVTAGSPLKPMRILMLVEASMINHVRKKVQEIVDSS